MKKPDKEVPATPQGKKMKEIISYLEDLNEWVDDMIDKNELQPYINKDGTVDDPKVDKSEDITPEQVAILGGYIMARRAVDAVKRIAKGSKPESIPSRSNKSVNAIGIAVDMSTGKAQLVGGDSLSQEVIDALKEIIENQEEQDD